MAKSCPQCGSISRDDLKVCAFCDSPLNSESDYEVVSVAVNSSPDLEWRQEVARKLQAYRRRRENAGHDTQTPLPFLEGPSGPLRRTRTVEIPLGPRPRSRQAAAEQVEIPVRQPSLDFTPPQERYHPEVQWAPVAGIPERSGAGLLDLFFVALVYSGFLFLFRSVGGQFAWTKLDAGILGASLFLLYVLYFSLFTVLGGATPGMMLGELAIVQMDGEDPTTSALIWRSIGYLLSGGAIFLGFVWAVLDEDSLTWHDRISQTYITSASIAGNDASRAFGENFTKDGA